MPNPAAANGMSSAQNTARATDQRQQQIHADGHDMPEAAAAGQLDKARAQGAAKQKLLERLSETQTVSFKPKVVKCAPNFE